MLLIGTYSLGQFIPQFIYSIDFHQYKTYNICINKDSNESFLVFANTVRKSTIYKESFIDITYKNEPIKIMIEDLFLLVAIMSFMLVLGRVIYTIYWCKPFPYERPTLNHFKLISIVLLITVILSLTIDLNKKKLYDIQLKESYKVIASKDNSTNLYKYECEQMKLRYKK